MSDYLNAIRSAIRAISPYHLKSREYKIKLNQNEFPEDLPGWLKNEIVDELRAISWNRYPDFSKNPLREKLASHLGVATERLLIGNGSNEILQMIFMAALSAGKKLLTVGPTFPIYQQLARVVEANLLALEFEDDWSFPVKRILSSLKRDRPELSVLCSPNSPTGASLPIAALVKILETAAGLVIVDEAYFEFSDASVIQLQNQFENLIITRTFSKAVGLAGLRIGYLVAHPKIVAEINKVKLPYNLNILSETVVCKLLEHPQVIVERIEKLRREKEWLRQKLARIDDVIVFPSAANFFMIETCCSSADVFERMIEQGVLVRDISGYHPRLQKKLRISVGTRTENEACVGALQQGVSELTTERQTSVWHG
jgi:histidinol-phosphate aminotransferase